MDKTKLSIILLVISLVLIVSAVIINNNANNLKSSQTINYNYESKPSANHAAVFLEIQPNGGTNENK